MFVSTSPCPDYAILRHPNIGCGLDIIVDYFSLNMKDNMN